jgi:hypothetical protein
LEITTAITTTQIHGIYDAHNFGLIASQQARDYLPGRGGGRGWTAPLQQRRQTAQRRTKDQTMVSFQSGGIKDAKTLQSRLVATLAALSTLGDAPSRPTKNRNDIGSPRGAGRFARTSDQF